MSPSLTHELRRMGVHIREEWMAAARDHLRTNVANFDALPLDKQASRVSAPLIRQSSPRGCYANEPCGHSVHLFFGFQPACKHRWSWYTRTSWMRT
jgi:hypothetical protein